MRDISMEKVNETRNAILDIIKNPTLTHEQKVSSMAGKADSLLEVTDSVMLDIKAFDKSQHYKVTAADNDMVLKNAVYLAEIGKLFEVRTVIVPELYNCRHTIIETGKLLADYQPIRYKLIAYRPMGVREQYRIYSVPSQELLEEYAKELYALNWKDVVII